VQGSLESANHAVNLLPGLVGSMPNGLAINQGILDTGEVDLLGADVASLEVLDDLSRVLLRFFRGVGIGDVGLRGVVYQSTATERDRSSHPPSPCGHR